MKLGKRNLLYSLVLASMMLVFLVGYFVYMLPSLYVDYRMEQNLRSVKDQHRAFAAAGSYADVQVQNPTACFSIKVPDEGDGILFASKLVTAEIILRDDRLRKVLSEIREYAEDYRYDAPADLNGLNNRMDGKATEWMEVFEDVFQMGGQMPVEVKVLNQMDGADTWHGEYSRMHRVSEDFFVLETGVQDANNQYLNYIAVERREEGLLVTLLPVLTPDMNEIRPVVLQSLPMLGVVVLLLVLLFSQVYSRGIVTPIVRLVQHTEEMKGWSKEELSGPECMTLCQAIPDGQNSGFKPGESMEGDDSAAVRRGCIGGRGSEPDAEEAEEAAVKRNCIWGWGRFWIAPFRGMHFHAGKMPERKPLGSMDEIGVLAVTVDELYCRLRESYVQLEEQNEALEEENRRQEVLLRASSHQLKTPIAAALLLVDGMYNRIGKYQDTQKYLPKVKEQLLSMKRMVEELLYLNHCGDSLDFQQAELAEVLRKQLEGYRIAVMERQLAVCVEGAESVWVCTDVTVFAHILDNLLSNAVNYTPEGGRIRIDVEEGGLTICNYGVVIDEELLPHIFEPFVSGSHGDRTGGADSHGLGLYIAAYYARKIGMQLRIENVEDGVAATVVFGG